jgi:(E)-4-hydroxy-3-methylbut-2-enyl-diphosphate synthase
MISPRHATRQIRVGPVAVGGGAPISVQTMTKTDTRDVAATVRQIEEVMALGCDLVRLAVPDEAAARALGEIRKRVTAPLIADIHFDHRLALLALAAGVDGLRINPGNIGAEAKVREVVAAARERSVPIRVGVNGGSLEKDLAERYGGATAEALVESALRHVGLLEKQGYEAIKISVKASGVSRTVEAYRLLAARTAYPLHLGVTEAGTLIAGTVRSSAALGILLAEGIGDTIRVSLTDTPSREVRVGLEILRALELRKPGPSVVSCPTCGRTEVDVVGLAERVEDALGKLYRERPDMPHPVVAVMGCVVNGPGEAKEADIALCGGKGKYALYTHGEHVRTVAEADALEAVIGAVRTFGRAM